MFQTHSFQAFNTFSLANLTCSLKLNQTQPNLSLITIEYCFGLSEKFRISISENNLCYDMKFVVSNLQGFYEYIKWIHEEQKFGFCEFTKSKIIVSFSVQIFNNEEKVIKQEFESTMVNDQVIWKSELKSKMDQIQSSLSKTIFSQINHQIKERMFEEKQMSMMKLDCLQKKFSRELQNMNKKLELFVDLIGNGNRNAESMIKSESTQRETRHRGRFQEQDQNDTNTLRMDSNNKRVLRGQVQKTKMISKSRLQNNNHLSNKNTLQKPSKNLNHDNIIRKSNQQKISHLEGHQQNIADKSKNRLKKQYRQLGHFDQPKIQTFFEKSQNESKNQNSVKQPFLIQKLNNRSCESFNTPRKRIQKQNSKVVQFSCQSQNKIKNPSFQMGIHMKQKTKQKYQQIHGIQKSEMVDEKFINPIKKSKIHSTDKLKDNSEGKLRGSTSFLQTKNNGHLSNQSYNNQSTFLISKPLSNEQSLRRQFFQKNTKTSQIIDLEDEEQMQRFKIITPMRQNYKDILQKIKEQECQVVHKIKIPNSGKMHTSEINKNQGYKSVENPSGEQNVNFIDQIMSSNPNQMIPQRNQENSQSIDINQMVKIVQSYKKNKLDEKINNKQQNHHGKSPLKLSQSGLKNQDNALNQLIDPYKQLDISVIGPAKLPSYDYLSNAHHFVPTFYSKESASKLLKYNLKDYYIFESQGRKIQKRSFFSKSEKNYISLVSFESFPITGRHFMVLRILKAHNYHICIGIVDMPSEIKVNQIPKNCDAIYLLDGGLHDEKGGSAKQNGWRGKEGQPVDVLKMELQVEKGELYVVTIVDMDKEVIEFYYNEEFISKTHFSSYCRRNKKKIHAYVALRTQKDCIEIV